MRALSGSFRVLDAARSVVDSVIALLDRPRRRMLYVDQLRESVGSIAANIREVLGRREGPERNQYFRLSRSSAEETDEHLSANWRNGRIGRRDFLPIHNRLRTIVKMLNTMLGY